MYFWTQHRYHDNTQLISEILQIFLKTVGKLINDEVQIYFKAQLNGQNGALRQVHAILAMIGKL